ncbi:esterase/lipase [Schizosaccharomyces japonicus yFS275]|uniref:Esterase/lipase n=1 Tax=Schizosaccharomyces japonicus (strain yFS275 / FY16936) TaxID=402676 RepID=B6JXW2_SCHJY|nr:esterase/lipase [Schizosaccharomyces japonicus yFS275]EEB06380.2 esterase/lipase [Schizosaccharomyces japonicus yFS275]
MYISEAVYFGWLIVSTACIVGSFQPEVHVALVKFVHGFLPKCSRYTLARLLACASEKPFVFLFCKTFMTFRAYHSYARYSRYFQQLYFLDMLGYGSLLAVIIMGLYAAHSLSIAAAKLTGKSFQFNTGASWFLQIRRLFYNDLAGELLHYNSISYPPDRVLAENNARRLVLKHNLILDVYAPEFGTNRPVIIWVSGTHGAPSQLPFILAHLGFVVVIPDFCRPPKFPVEKSVEFIHYVVDWVRENVDYYHGDSSTIGILGEDTGAAVAAAVAAKQKCILSFFALCPRNDPALPFSTESTPELPVYTLHPGSESVYADSDAKAKTQSIINLENDSSIYVFGSFPFYYCYESPRSIATAELIQQWFTNTFKANKCQ